MVEVEVEVLVPDLLLVVQVAVVPVDLVPVLQVLLVDPILEVVPAEEDLVIV
jgi:hypothetical protein